MASDLPPTIMGDGPALLCLHGGPGLSDYLNDLTDLDDETVGWRRINYTQRGLAPSTTEGPFTVAQHVADAIAVLDGLRVREAVVLGHSWGGFLGAVLAMEHPDRVRGLVMVDPLGIVGDGGYHRFEEQMLARTPEDVRKRAEELDQRVMAGDGTEEDAHESFALVWPAYFHDPANAGPVLDVKHSVACNSQAFEDLLALLEEGTLPERAAEYGGPVEVVYGLSSPFAPEVSIETAQAFPQGSATGIAEAGHFCWLEQPGSIADALVRLAARLP